MTPANPAPDNPHPAVPALLLQARQATYCKPALHSLASALPGDDTTILAAIDEAARTRDATAFGHLYLAALLASRHLPARILATGAPLLPSGMMLISTSPYLDGPVVGPLTDAVRSRRLPRVWDAYAMAACLLDCERHGTPAPPDLIALTRRICLQNLQTRSAISLAFSQILAELAADPVIDQLVEQYHDQSNLLDQAVDELRVFATQPIWRDVIPNTPPSTTTIAGTGSPLKRAVPKAGRNDPCPCGSGRKFKQCCDGKATMADQYEVEGVTLTEAAAHPELLLTAKRIMQLHSHELYGLYPNLLSPDLVGLVARQLVNTGEISRAIEILQHYPPDAYSEGRLDDVAYEFLHANDTEALRWLHDWAGDRIFDSFEMQFLLAPAAERYQAIQSSASSAFETHLGDPSAAMFLFTDLAHAVLRADPALGLLIARGVLPYTDGFEHELLSDAIIRARIELGLADDEPFPGSLHASSHALGKIPHRTTESSNKHDETAARLDQRDAEMRKLKQQIDELQRKLAIREATPPDASGPATTLPPAQSAETRELRENLRRLKENLKIEHHERNRAMRELHAAREELLHASQPPPGQPDAVTPLPQPESDADADDTPAIAWEAQALRVPEFTPPFRDAMSRLPRQPCAAALAVAGRLAAGDPSVWKTARALKMRPGTLRVRVAGDYRLLFQAPSGDTLCFLDFISRRDLERWIATHR